MNKLLKHSTAVRGTWTKQIATMVTIAMIMTSLAFSQYGNPVPVPLLSAGTYGALAYSGISGSANVSGDVGTTTGAIVVTILPSGTNWGVGGVHNGQAQTDLAAALADVSGRANDEGGVDALGGLTLGRGVYSGGAVALASNTTLTLNGSASDVFIIKAASSLTINTNTTIALTGGAVWTNVYWYVGSSATLFSGSTFNGIILANVSITVNTGAALVTAKLLANTGAVTINSDVLPVELTRFAATAHQTGAELLWSTATEVNNYGFEVERKELIHRSIGSLHQSTDDSLNQWTMIGFVEGHGTTNAPKSYSFVDGSASGTVAYRLKQIDRDGKFSYSESVVLTIGNATMEFGLMQNYPNPFNPTTKIHYSIGNATHVSVKVYDLLGGEVATLVNELQEAGMYDVSLNVHNRSLHLPSGVYFYRLEAGNFISTKKFVLLK